jgi:hypothetical protein
LPAALSEQTFGGRLLNAFKIFRYTIEGGKLFERANREIHCGAYVNRQEPLPEQRLCL